jgi:uncharacterized CHY-type Zn-finger protein
MKEGNYMKRVLVNGAWIEEVFLQENIKEALGVEWEEKHTIPMQDHFHCIICNIALGSISNERMYQSKIGMLCNFCFDSFINQCKRD